MKEGLKTNLCLFIMITMTITQTKSLPIDENSSRTPVTANPSDENDYDYYNSNYYYTDYTTDHYYSYNSDYYSTDYYSTDYYYDYGTTETEKEKAS